MNNSFSKGDRRCRDGKTQKVYICANKVGMVCENPRRMQTRSRWVKKNQVQVSTKLNKSLPKSTL